MGNASGAGFPAANEITPGSEVNLRISLIAEACNPLTLSENLYSIGYIVLSLKYWHKALKISYNDIYSCRYTDKHYMLIYIITHNSDFCNIYFIKKAKIFHFEEHTALKKQDFIKGSVILMVSAAAAKVLGAVYKIPLTNMLGGVGMSYFSCAYSIFMPVYAFAVTGLSSAVAAMTAGSSAFGMYGNIRRIRRTALGLFSLVGIVGSLLILLLAKPFSIFSSGSTDAALAIAMIAPSVFFGCIAAVERGYYEGLNNMYPTALSQVAEGIVRVAAGLWLCGYVSSHSGEIMSYFPFITDVRALAAAAGIAGVTLSSVGAVIFLGIINIFSGKGRKEGSTKTDSREIRRELIKTALPVGAGSVVTNLTAIIDMSTIIGCISFFGYRGNVPVSVAAEDIPEFVYGSFSGIALTIFNLIPSVTNMLGKGILPCIASAWAAGDRENLQKSTTQALLTAAVIAVPSAVGIGVISPQILGILFSQQTDEAEICVSALRWLMVGMVCLCLSFPVFAMLQGIGKSSAPLKIMLVGTAVKAAGNFGLIPFMGVDGAAVSTSLCYVVILALSLYTYIKAAEVKISPMPFLGVLHGGLLCGAAAYLAADISRRNGAEDISSAIAAVICGGGVYLLSLYLLSIKVKRTKTAICA